MHNPAGVSQGLLHTACRHYFEKVADFVHIAFCKGFNRVLHANIRRHFVGQFSAHNFAGHLGIDSE